MRTRAERRFKSRQLKSSAITYLESEYPIIDNVCYDRNSWSGKLTEISLEAFQHEARRLLVNEGKKRYYWLPGNRHRHTWDCWGDYDIFLKVNEYDTYRLDQQEFLETFYGDENPH